jgi:inhibitor of cysteine peptidase
LRENKDIKDLMESFENIQIPAELDLTIEKAIGDGRKLKNKSYLYKAVASAACAAVFILAAGTFTKGAVNIPDKSYIAKSSLPVVGSFNNLQALISGTYQDIGEVKGGAAVHSALDEKSSISNTFNGSLYDSTKEYSKTNNQIEGVDEADSVKTDGEYIYKITNRTNQNDIQGIQIIKASPAQNMVLAKQIDVPEILPSKIFVKDNYLVVLGTLIKASVGPSGAAETTHGPALIDRTSIGNSSTVIYIYDIKDKSNINRVRDIVVDGSFTSARMIESNIYIISNKYIDKVLLDDTKNHQEILPSYKDSVIGKEAVTLNFNNIKYFPKALEPNYILLSSINLDKINEKINVTCTLGSGRNIFCSEDNLYIAGYNYKADKQYTTTIYKFNLKNNNMDFTGSGNVPGNILNQFSMDENNGYFRIATTNNFVENGTNASTNNLYILDKGMKLTGKLEGLAKGERIYAARFMGDRAYIVTFKNTDPLFVLDLKNPAEPKVLGELKIPGFSNYLHPYDENHLIGIGINTAQSGKPGKVIVKQTGMKLAIFDVSDVNNPKQNFMTTIGNSGTYSEALNDPKAFLFSKDKNLLAFPIPVTEMSKDHIIKNTFVGAYVYNIDLTNGFTFKGGITHMTTTDFRSKDYNWNGGISRVLYIKDNLYTISESAIKANNMKDLKEVGYLKLKLGH